jgi:hypothetical protein
MSWCWGNGIAGEQAERRRVVRPRQDIGSWSGADSHIWLEGPRVCRLSAGGRWIRTIGTQKISYRFETDFVASVTIPVPERDSFLSRRGTDSSNPVPSGGESTANRSQIRTGLAGGITLMGSRKGGS